LSFKAINKSFLYKYAKYPNHELVYRINIASQDLKNKLLNFDVTNLNISDYNKRYFSGYIDNIDLNLTKYGYVLAWALAYVDKPISEVTFLDYGAGHGMLSLLAKQLGVGKVLHNDIFIDSTKDGQIIGNALSLKADDYITGGIDEVLLFSKNAKIDIDSIASYDVIEHIYDINDFLMKLHLLSSKKISMFHASAANQRNPWINRSIRAMHKEFELFDRKPKFGRKPTDTTKSLIKLRQEIIGNYTKKLSSDVVYNIAKLTRGLLKDDIENCVEIYIKNGSLPKPLTHPTNTCDPFTGNWFEHLMDTNDLINTLKKTGFNTKTICGYYDQPNNPIKLIIKQFLNIIIRILGHNGLIFAPYYALSARK
jgi:2-polyprenyl-3-methyl-5-hydroxy-6-metoxy-1,4-benzoquinol methylase